MKCNNEGNFSKVLILALHLKNGKKIPKFLEEPKNISVEKSNDPLDGLSDNLLINGLINKE